MLPVGTSEGEPNASSKPAASANYKALSAFILLPLSVMFLSRHW